MKKFIFLIVSVLLVAAILASCTHPETIETTTKEHSSNTEISSTINISIKSQENSTTIGNDGDTGGGYIKIQKYRCRFYDVPGPFVSLVGREAWYEWLNTVNHAETAEVMVMKLFIENFNISREDFDKANLELAKRIKNDLRGSPCLVSSDYANQEDYEIFNADIIYTFDDDIIREYYLSPDYPYTFDFEFEEAVEKGEYTSQTEEWVDIKKMEAEVIAKYGNIEYETKPEVNLGELFESRRNAEAATAVSD